MWLFGAGKFHKHIINMILNFNDGSKLYKVRIIKFLQNTMYMTLEDNTFAYARLWFKNMDKLIEVMNKFAGNWS